MVLSVIKGLLNVVGRWWWPGARGMVYLPPDVQQLFSWPVPRVTRWWLAAFFDHERHEHNPKLRLHEKHESPLCPSP